MWRTRAYVVGKGERWTGSAANTYSFTTPLDFSPCYFWNPNLVPCKQTPPLFCAFWIICSLINLYWNSLNLKENVSPTFLFLPRPIPQNHEKSSMFSLFPSSYGGSYSPRPTLTHHHIKTPPRLAVWSYHSIPAYDVLSQTPGWSPPFFEDLGSWFSLFYYSQASYQAVDPSVYSVLGCWLLALFSLFMSTIHFQKNVLDLVRLLINLWILKLKHLTFFTQT